MNRRDFLEIAGAVSAGMLAPGFARTALAEGTALSFASTTGAVGLTTQVVTRNSLAKQHGLALEARVLSPAGAEHATLIGQTNAGIFSTISAAEVDLKGQDIVCFGPALYMHSSLIVWKDAPYQTLADLKGKRISLLNKVSGAYRGMQLLASWQGLDLEKDFHLVTAPPPAIITFLERKQVEAIVIHDPLVSKLLASGNFRIIFEMNDVWKQKMKGDWLFLGYAAHEKWLTDNRATAQRLLDTLLEAAQDIRSHPDLIGAEAEFLGLKSKEEISLATERMPKIFPIEWNEASVHEALEGVRAAVTMKQIPGMPQGKFIRVLG